MLRKKLQQTYLRRLAKSAHPVEIEEFSQDALVFAPHQDDETLGCGGTILLKRRAGAQVRIIFMADGTSSHSHLIPADELMYIREKEAVAASQHLGVEEKDIFFLRVRDGALVSSTETAIREVSKILGASQPKQVFLPYHKEPTPDHVATHTIVTAALQECYQHSTIYEYPVWFWQHWPWISLIQVNRRQTRDAIKNTISAKGGLGFLKAFQSIVDIRDVLEEKRAALAQHASQMTQLRPDPSWLTLHDVYKGEFLPCFFHGYEVFYRHPHHTKEPGLLTGKGR